MPSRWRRIAVQVTLVGAGACLFAHLSSGCRNFAVESALTAADFCFIFDCENGLFGGTLDPCPPQATQPNGIQLPLFRDCPELAGGP